MKYVGLACFLMAMFSLCFYAFTGMTLWSPIGDKDGLRVLIIIYLHIGGLAGGFFWYTR